MIVVEAANTAQDSDGPGEHLSRIHIHDCPIKGSAHARTASHLMPHAERSELAVRSLHTLPVFYD